MKAATSNLRIAAHPPADKGKTEGASLQVFFVGVRVRLHVGYQHLEKIVSGQTYVLRTEAYFSFQLSFKVIVFLY